jgi:hypothetical protein
VDYFLVLHKVGIYGYTRTIEPFRRLVEDKEELKQWDTSKLVCAGQNFTKDVTVSEDT